METPFSLKSVVYYFLAAFGGVAAMGTYLAANDVTPNDIRRAYFRVSF